MKKVLIIGNGAFGVAMSQILLSNKNCEVFMFSKNIETGQELLSGKHFLFPNKQLQPPHKVYSVYEDAFKNNIDVIVLCVPSIAINDIFLQIKPYLNNKIVIVNTAKGLNPNNQEMWSKLFLQDNLVHDYCLMVGPSFASELVDKQRTIVNLVGNNLSTIKMVEDLFNNDYFKLIYFSDEYVASLVSSFKNSLAVGLGLLSVYCSSINTQAAYLIIGINEVQFLLSQLTCCRTVKILDFFGLGDIYLTCTSDESRNYQYGIKIGKIGVVAANDELNSSTVEGYRTLKLIKEYIDKYQIESVFFKTLYEICYEGREPKTFVDYIWNHFKNF